MRVPTRNCEEVKKTVSLLRIFNGMTPVHFYFNDTKKYQMNCGITADINESLIDELKKILGTGNVVLKK